jgi:hypothetical protein
MPAADWNVAGEAHYAAAAFTGGLLPAAGNTRRQALSRGQDLI